MKAYYDVIVVGLGLVGSGAIRCLAEKGLKVLGIDQYSPPHKFGSSHGDTRITRLGIGEGEFYSNFAIRSHEIWRDLEVRTGLDLLNLTGGLIMASQSSKYSLHGNSDFLGETIRAAEKYDIDHWALDTKDIRAMFPQLNLVGDEAGYYEPTAGFLRPENCIRANLSLARISGALLLAKSKIVDIVPSNSGTVDVYTDDGRVFMADKVIISVGAWINRFLGPIYSRFFTVQRQGLYWFDIESAYNQFKPEKFPIFIWKRAEDFIYGFPAIDGLEGGLKVASEESNKVDPDNVNREISHEEIKAMYNRVSVSISGIGSTCVKAVACLYTATPDSHFVVDYLPDFRQVIIASPCSGHGAKHSAAIGETLAEMATDNKTSFDITPFSLKRFSI